MKKLLLCLLVFPTIVNAQVQYADFKCYIEKTGTYSSMEDTSTPFYGIQMEPVFTGTPLKEVFRGSYDRTNDNIFYAMRGNFYVVYLPDNSTKMTYFVQSNNTNVGQHLLELISEIRKYRARQKWMGPNQ